MPRRVASYYRHQRSSNLNNIYTYQNLNRARKVLQIVSVLFLIAVPLLNWLGVHWILGTLYAISIGDLDIVDPAMALQTILLTKELILPLVFATLAPIVLALAFGRVFCSWVCPHNTITEWMQSLQQRLWKVRWREVHFTAITKNQHPWITWGMLSLLLVGTMILGFPLLSYLSMPGILSSTLSQAILGMGIGLEIGLVMLVLVVEMLLFRRYWCKSLCPVGAVLSLFRLKGTLHVHHETAICDCREGSEPCRYTCPLDLSPKQIHLYPNCFNCGICVAMCEKTGRKALSFRMGLDHPEAESVAHSSLRTRLRILQSNS